VAVMCVVGRSSGTLCNWGGPVVRALDQAARNLSRQLGFLDAPIETQPSHAKARKSIHPPGAA
jgi:hypothetical protein